MMKKILAGFIVMFFALMSFVLVQGFLDNKNNQSPSSNSGSTSSGSGSSSSKDTSGSQSSKTFSLDEVASHSNRNDCWLIISGKVYDVTSFINEHPGGAAQIISSCGKEATTQFQTQDGEGRHSRQADAMLADYLIGTLQ